MALPFIDRLQLGYGVTGRTGERGYKTQQQGWRIGFISRGSLDLIQQLPSRTISDIMCGGGKCSGHHAPAPAKMPLTPPTTPTNASTFAQSTVAPMTPDLLFKNGKFVLDTDGSDGVSAKWDDQNPTFVTTL